MSDTSLSVPGQNGGGLAEMPADGPQGPYLSDWDLDLGPETAQGLTFQRALLALRRFWWLILIAALLGVAGGFVAYRMVEPVYTAGAEILVSGEREGNATPIQADPLMQEQALIDLLKSPEVVEPVVRRERLFLSYPRGTEDLFMGFDLSPEGARFGRYEFAASGSGEWTLLNAAGVEVDQGRAGDAVGASVGFEWNPPPAQLQGGLAPVEFAVRPPRETATSIRSELLTNMNEAGNFIRVSYASKNPELAARVVNGLLDEFQAVAASLKEDELEADLANLVIQLEGAKDSLYMVTEMLESFRIRTMSEPRQQSIVTPGGTETLRVPQQDEYLSLRGQQQDVDRQLQVLRSIQAEIPRGGLSIPRLESVPRAAQSAEISGMLLRLAELRQQRSDLLLRYTPQHPSVLDLDEDIRRIEQEQIPVTLSSLIDQLARESSDLQGRIAQADSDMRRVPRLMSEEQNLQEEQRRFQTLVNDLSNRRTLAEFAFRSSLADFQVLSDATVPFTPSSDKRLSFAAVVFIGFLGLGLGGALVLDRMDSRFRYPEDVTSGIGVDVLGMIPRVSGSGTQAEVEEAFRDLRMRLMYAHGSAGPLMVVFSSPGPGEGKTLITANLALAFAKIGRRTLVIDADTRRGDLHRLMGEDRGVGLVDYLAGGSDGKIIHRTEYENLFFMGSGTRLSRAPELLAGERIRHLFMRLKDRYDVILVDAPPLGAGADAFHLATLTGSMALVLRAGESEKSMVERKLQALSHLPVRVLGGILNDVSSAALKGYGYYSYYLPGYEAGGEDDRMGEYVPALTTGDLPEIGEADD